MKHTESFAEAGPPIRKMVALMTSDVVLAMDIQEALASIGLGAYIEQGYDTGTGPCGASAAIVDLKVTDIRSQQAVAWLSAQNVPVITISMDDAATSIFQRMPSVIASFSKPFCVDTLLPSVLAAAAANDGPSGIASEG